MKEKNAQRLVKVLLLKTTLIFVLVLFIAGPFSCKVTEEGIVLVNENTLSPEIEDYFVTSETSARIVFNQKVDINEYSMTPALQVENVTIQAGDENNSYFVDVLFSENLALGKDYNFYGEVKDDVGNTLTFSLPFSGFNARVPELEITEVHPKYTSATKAGVKYYKCEYIELRALSEGNLFGVELYSSYDGSEKSYVFPSIEICKDEIIIVHLRKKEDTAINEIDSDFTLSKTKYSCDTARDLWAENDSARLGDEMDVILLRNSRDGRIIDSLCYAKEEAVEWKTEQMAVDAKLAFDAGKWNDSSINGAVRFSKITATKSFERFFKESAASSWRLSGTSGETPGVVCY